MSKDGCNHFYFLGGGAKCLHQLFAEGHIKAISREVTPHGVEFRIYNEKLVKQKRGRYAGKYWLGGSQSKLSSREQVLLALELTEKYKHVMRVRL